MTEEETIDYIDSNIKKNGKRSILGSVLNTALKAIIGLISGAGGTPTWGGIEGTISDQTDLNSALAGKQNSLGFTPENSANKGSVNGYAPLNASVKIDTTYLPDSILGQLLYGGVVNATTAVATLTNSAKSKLGTSYSSITLTNDATAITGYVANEGIYYIATTSGTFASISFEVGDWLISIGSSWQKIDNTDAISSFNNRTGAIVLTESDVTDALGFTPEDESNKSTNIVTDQLSNIKYPTVKAIFDWVVNLLGGKVDKVAGKGLSTEDYTTTEKSKLSGIQAGAEVNVNADWNATSGDAQILNKPTIPSAQVNSDWNAVSGVAEILNKPTIPSAVTNTSDLINDGADGVNPFITALDIPTAGQAGTLVREVKNMTGATLTKGTVVYISGANGNKALVSKARANAESTSARTFGLIQSDILNNGVGYCVVIGDISGLDTSAFTEGAQLYLSGTVAGEYTSTKTLAPTHLVYIGKVTRSHPTLGQIEVQIQNGYELSEIHDCDLITTTPVNGHILGFDGNLWVNKTIATWLGFTPENVTNKGAALGYVPLNSLTKIDTTYFPDVILGQLLYGGVVNATTAVATLTNNAKTKLGIALASITLTNDTTAITGYVANEGIYYISTTSGTFASISFEVGDWLLSVGSSWQKIDNTDAISSFNSRTGAITLLSSDVTGALTYTPITNARTINTTSPLSGGGNLTADRTFSIAQSNTSTDGYLSSTDWNTFNSKANKSASTTGVAVSFITPQVYNSIASPGSGSITDNLTGAAIGVVQKIYHNDISLTVPSLTWVKLGSGTYTPSSLNIIYAEWVSGTRVEYWIVKGS